jgi:hypothetical protein
VGPASELQTKLITECHASTIGGHSRIPVTYRKIKQLFAWKGMKLTVHDFVQRCLICQQAKPDKTRCPGLLQPLEIPEGA